jgi:TPR repeat protein/uncharacterized caspase-like protein
VQYRGLAGRIGRGAGFACVAWILAWTALTPACAAKRVALVIGNGAYANAPVLVNPVNDSGDIAASFERLGFSVTKLSDAGFDAMRRGLNAFGHEAQGSEIAVIYFAGHGMEIGGENWLIPVDAELRSDTDVEGEAIGLKVAMLQVAKASRLGLVILDACRSNPFAKMQRSDRKRAVDRGFVRVEPTNNVLVAYAARDGTTANDGNGRNSPYTEALLKNLETPGLEIRFLFASVRDDVMAATNQNQQPFDYGSLSKEPVYLKAPAKVTTPQQEARLPEPSDPLRRDLVTDCDRLAANPADTQRPKGIAGVWMAQIDIVPALTACDAAMSQYPEVARFAFQAGRIAEKQKDYSAAHQLYEKAAGMGKTLAMNNLGQLYEEGNGVPKDYAEARAWYEKAVAAGDPNSMLNIGFLYAQGHGVTKDYAEERKWYEKAAAAGSARALSNLGVLYQHGNGVTQDYAEARKWYEKAAAAGDIVGINNLGSLYRDGNGVAQDYAEARKWYEKAAAAGQLDAMTSLGILYEYGRGIAQDYSEARKWYEKAAVDEPYAMTNLGLLYENGRGVAQDYAEARKWYEKGATAGQSRAMIRLGGLFENGLGVAQDYAEARKWYDKASPIDPDKARVALDNLSEREKQNVKKPDNEPGKRSNVKRNSR